MARQKFDVYPSAYANGWAAKYYKSKGGTWRKGEYGMYMKDGGKMFAQSGMNKPIYTSNPYDPRIRRFNDSLTLNNLTRAYEPMFMRNPYDERLRTYNTVGEKISSRTGIKPTRVRTEDNEYAIDRSFDPMLMEQAYLAKFKRPVQPVKYADPKIVEKQKMLKDAGLYSGDLDGIWGSKSEEAFKKYEESKATPTSTVSRESTPRVSPTPAVKGSGPVLQRWGQMTDPEIRRKAIKKYGDPSKFPLQGVDIRTLEKGGKVSVKAGGENHVVYKKETKQGEGKVGNIMVNHPTMDKGKWDTIDLTQKAGAKTVAEGVAATKKWHKENPYPKKKMQMGGMTPAQQAAKKLAMNMKGKVVGSDRMLKHGGKMFGQVGMVNPIYTSNPNDPRLRRYNDSLTAYKANRWPEHNEPIRKHSVPKETYVVVGKNGEGKDIWGSRPYKPKAMEPAFEYDFVDNNQVGKEAIFEKIGKAKSGNISTMLLYKKPVQPYIYQKPTSEIKGSAAINKTFYNMTPEERQKAVKKYGSPNNWPFQGVDVGGFKKGGKTSKLKQAYFNKYK
jgi:hypothetical protein